MLDKRVEMCYNKYSEREVIKMKLTDRVKRIREIDKQITALMDELHSLYYDGLTTAEHNRLYDKVMSDGESHWG